MKSNTDFSFNGKTVTVVGGKGKMWTSFWAGLVKAGAQIHIVDQDTEPLWKNPQTDAILFALDERRTLRLMKQLRENITKNIPIITTSSVNGLLWKLHWDTKKGGFAHLTPIHALCSANMKWAVMIDCATPGTLASSVTSEIARIMEMEREYVPFEHHDREIARGQAEFHREVWNFVRETPDLVRYISLLPISQRRPALGNSRVLLRPDISAEFLAAFGGDDETAEYISCNWWRGKIWCHLSHERTWADKLSWIDHDSDEVRLERIKKWLSELIQEKDPEWTIRDWIKTENARMDQWVPGGPRSFQEFLRETKS